MSLYLDELTRDKQRPASATSSAVGSNSGVLLNTTMGGNKQSRGKDEKSALKVSPSLQLPDCLASIADEEQKKDSGDFGENGHFVMDQVVDGLPAAGAPANVLHQQSKYPRDYHPRRLPRNMTFAGPSSAALPSYVPGQASVAGPSGVAGPSKLNIPARESANSSSSSLPETLSHGKYATPPSTTGKCLPSLPLVRRIGYRLTFHRNRQRQLRL